MNEGPGQGARGALLRGASRWGAGGGGGSGSAPRLAGVPLHESRRGPERSGQENLPAWAAPSARPIHTAPASSPARRCGGAAGSARVRRAPERTCGCWRAPLMPPAGLTCPSSGAAPRLHCGPGERRGRLASCLASAGAQLQVHPRRPLGPRAPALSPGGRRRRSCPAPPNQPLARSLAHHTHCLSRLLWLEILYLPPMTSLGPARGKGERKRVLLQAQPSHPAQF